MSHAAIAERTREDASDHEISATARLEQNSQVSIEAAELLERFQRHADSDVEAERDLGPLRVVGNC